MEPWPCGRVMRSSGQWSGRVKRDSPMLLIKSRRPCNPRRGLLLSQWRRMVAQFGSHGPVLLAMAVPMPGWKRLLENWVSGGCQMLSWRSHGQQSKWTSSRCLTSCINLGPLHKQTRKNRCWFRLCLFRRGFGPRSFRVCACSTASCRRAVCCCEEVQGQTRCSFPTWRGIPVAECFVTTRCATAGRDLWRSPR